tara:strand:+ start:1661 stop:2170 length:510 start_codon:yes stop_codon:yes gene_type:complete
MLADEYLRDELNKFAKYVIQQSRTNLTKGKKRASNELYRSLGYEVNESAKTTSLAFEMVDYGKFQDRGVSGKNKKYNTPYSYTTKMPPPQAFDKWVVRKGIAPRTKGGKFTSRESLKFAIAKSIYKNGIRPSMFFTKPFEAAFKRLPDELIEAYSIGIEKQIQVNIDKK